jgi:enamine deaminase RidA (YjgF/YER057c/UK114 family)
VVLEQILIRMATVLTPAIRMAEEAGSGLDNVVKVLSFLADIRDFDEYNEAYGEFFKRDGNAPARSTIEARLWGGIGVEIEMVAYIPDK